MRLDLNVIHQVDVDHEFKARQPDFGACCLSHDPSLWVAQESPILSQCLEHICVGQFSKKSENS